MLQLSCICVCEHQSASITSITTAAQTQHVLFISPKWGDNLLLYLTIVCSQSDEAMWQKLMGGAVFTEYVYLSNSINIIIITVYMAR